MNNNLIKFYLLTNKLKGKIRTGWQELGISSNRLESVAEHVYGCLMLAIALDSEYKLELDMYKVLKMLSLHELEETIMKDYTVRDNISREEKLKKGGIELENSRKAVFSKLIGNEYEIKIEDREAEQNIIEIFFIDPKERINLFNKQEGEVTIGEEKGYVHNNILIIYKTINSDMKTKIETILNM